MNDKIKLKRVGSVWLFVLPALIPLIVFWIYPILRSFYISMTDWDYMSPTYNFVFLDNFKTLFHDARFYSALINTLVFTLGTLIPTIVLGLLLDSNVYMELVVARIWSTFCILYEMFRSLINYYKDVRRNEDCYEF